MSDRDEAELRGPVSRCSTVWDSIFPDHHLLSEMVDSFSPTGNLVEQVCRDSTGVQSSIICRYDDRDRIIGKESWSAYPAFSNRAVYRYDSAGRLDTVLQSTDTKPEWVSESVRYGDDGTRTHTLYPEALTEQEKEGRALDAEMMFHFSFDAVAILTFFDANGRVARKVLYDADDRVIRRVLFRYDSRGLLIEEGEAIAGTIRDDFRHRYRYDESGRQIEVDMKWGDFGGKRKVCSYNDHGDVAEECVTYERMLFGGSSASCTSWFSYRYDEVGNWIERITETNGPDDQRKVDAIVRRKIAYH